jgi:hypothetical protein
MRVTFQSLWISNARSASFANVGRSRRRAVSMAELGIDRAVVMDCLADCDVPMANPQACHRPLSMRDAMIETRFARFYFAAHFLALDNILPQCSRKSAASFGPSPQEMWDRP